MVVASPLLPLLLLSPLALLLVPSLVPSLVEPDADEASLVSVLGSALVAGSVLPLPLPLVLVLEDEEDPSVSLVEPPLSPQPAATAKINRARARVIGSDPITAVDPIKAAARRRRRPSPRATSSIARHLW